MTTVHAATEYSSDIGAFGEDPDTVPDHRISDLREILDLVELADRGGRDRRVVRLGARNAP